MLRNDVKIGLYTVFLILACVFGALMVASYKQVTSESSDSGPSRSAEGAAVTKEVEQSTPSGYGRLLVYGAVFVVSVIGFGLLVGHDVSHYVANRVLKGGYSEEGESISDPEYELAEQEWANGRHLEAINMMREYLKKNPRE